MVLILNIEKGYYQNYQKSKAICFLLLENEVDAKLITFEKYQKQPNVWKPVIRSNSRIGERVFPWTE
jgi:hypothetical protein